MNKLKKFGQLFVFIGVMIMTTQAFAQTPPNDADNFYTSDKVSVQKVRFKNQYKMDVVGNLFIPKGMDMNKAYPAIIVGHPMGAVKEQSSNLYATKMAEYGFVTLAIDLPFAKVKGSHAMPYCLTCMQKPSAQQSIILGHVLLSTEII